MKKLLRFIIPLFIIVTIIGIEQTLRKIPNDYKYKADYLKENGKQIETLILGSSHTFTGLNPKLFKNKTFNAAHSAQSLDLDYKIFEQNRKYLPNLKTIIIPISYFSFTKQLNDFNQKKLKYYSIYWNIDINNNDLNLNYEFFSEPIEVNYNRIKDYWIEDKNNFTIDTNGYIKKRYEPSWNDSIYAKKTFERHRANLNSNQIQRIIKTHYHDLEQIIKQAKSNNIKVVLLATPTTNLYKNYVIKTPQYFNLKNNINRLSKYDNVIFIDYFINNENFTKKDFKNSDHLNAKGADKLTFKVDSIMNKTFTLITK
ncbi:hypothetical protein [Empedobacter falsenii]